MPIIQIRVLLQDETSTPNFRDGSPEVVVHVDVNGTRILTNGRALIDTGASNSAIHPRHMNGRTPDGVLTVDTVNGPNTLPQFAVFVTVDGLPTSRAVGVAAMETRFDFIMGRDLLSNYRMVLDPFSSTYTLEER